MGALTSRIGLVADGALLKGTSIALQVYELDRISLFGTGCDSVGAVMTGFAIDTSMPLRKSVEVVILLAVVFLSPGGRKQVFRSLYIQNVVHKIQTAHHTGKYEELSNISGVFATREVCFRQ